MSSEYVMAHLLFFTDDFKVEADEKYGVMAGAPSIFEEKQSVRREDLLGDQNLCFMMLLTVNSMTLSPPLFGHLHIITQWAATYLRGSKT